MEKKWACASVILCGFGVAICWDGGNYTNEKKIAKSNTHTIIHTDPNSEESERERRRIWTEPRKPKNQNKQIDWKYRALFLCKIMLHETVVGFVWAGAVYLLLVLIRSVFGLCRCVVFCFDVFCLARSARVRGKWIFLHLSAYMCGGIHFSWLFFFVQHILCVRSWGCRLPWVFRSFLFVHSINS